MFKQWLLVLIIVCAATAAMTQTPPWSNANALGTPRFDHTATLLANGKVLVVGGFVRCAPACQATNVAELYDPATGAWSSAGTVPTAFGTHAAVRLANGKVLVISGFSPPGTLLRTAYLYDPDSNGWTPTGAPVTARQYHQAALLPSGKVLVTGGLANPAGGRFTPTNLAEIYDPATGQWSATASMNAARFYHALTVLPTGKVLVVNGSSVVSNTPPFARPLTSCELYDPATGQWSATGETALPRTTPTTTVLPNGKVLMAGGTNNNVTENPTNLAELYDPATGQWNATGNMSVVRDYHTATLLTNGKVLLAGGYGNGYAPLKSADLYDPVTGSWALTSDMDNARHGHTATLLNNGKVFVTGGATNVDTPQGTSSAELYDTGASALASVSAASFAAGGAPDSIAAGFGANLTNRVETASSLPLPTELAGVSVRVRDSAGIERLAGLFFAAPSQINYLIPNGTALGTAFISVSNGAAGTVEITSTAPGIFAANANGQGVAAALALRVRADGSQSYEAVARLEGSRFVSTPIDLGPANEQVFLVLFGTGLRAQRSTTARLGDTDDEVLFAGEVAGLAGLDQVNVRIPRSLAGRGEIDIALTVDGRAANTVRVNVR